MNNYQIANKVSTIAAATECLSATLNLLLDDVQEEISVESSPSRVSLLYAPVLDLVLANLRDVSSSLTSLEKEVLA